VLAFGEALAHMALARIVLSALMLVEASVCVMLPDGIAYGVEKEEQTGNLVGHFELPLVVTSAVGFVSGLRWMAATVWAVITIAATGAAANRNFINLGFISYSGSDGRGAAGLTCSSAGAASSVGPAAGGEATMRLRDSTNTRMAIATQQGTKDE